MGADPPATEPPAMTAARPALSVVIPSYNGRRLLEACLASLVRHRPRDGSVEVIVADDASTDDTAAWVARTYPDVRLVRNARNGGFVAAANAGLAAARGEFVQMLNNDAEVTAGWAAAGLAPFADPRVGSVAPLVIMRGDPDRVDSAGDGYSLVGWAFKRGHGQPSRDWRDHPADRVLGASASSAFYRASALAAVGGGFDPLYGSYYEDVDLALRLQRAGYACAFTPECRVLHDVSASFNHRNPKLQRTIARNVELLFWSNLPAGTLAMAVLPHLAFVAAQVPRRLVRGTLRPFLLGKLDALRLHRAVRERRHHRAALAANGGSDRLPLDFFPLRTLREHLRAGRAATRRGTAPVPAPHVRATNRASRPGDARR
jgi:GT2 family glycosyltransferase